MSNQTPTPVSVSPVANPLPQPSSSSTPQSSELSASSDPQPSAPSSPQPSNFSAPLPPRPTSAPSTSQSPSTPSNSHPTSASPTPPLPLLQSHPWQTFQAALGEPTFFERNCDFQYLAIKKSTPLGHYLYLPYGPYLASKNAAQTAYEALQAIAKAQNAIFIRFEPQSPENASYWLSRHNCHKSPDLNPAHTWRLDLTPNLDQIYANMRQNTRNLCKNYAKKGLTVTTSKNPDDIRHLIALQRPLAAAKNISTFSENYLKTELRQPFATLYLVHLDPNVAAELAKSATSESTNAQPDSAASESMKTSPDFTPENQVVGASLFFDFEGTRFYMQSATSLAHRRLPITYALLGEAIKDAKSQGLTTFDFWGIAPDNSPADHPWAGFTAFKKSFGGYPVTYAGTHDLVLSSVKYRAYQLMRQANLLRRKITR